MARPHRRADAAPIDTVLHALGDPTRRRMIELLGVRPRSVGALAELCAISVTAVGQHLRLLEAAGLATSVKLGRVRSCQLDRQGLALLGQWLADRRSLWETRLDALGALLPAGTDPPHAPAGGPDESDADPRDDRGHEETPSPHD